MKFIYYMSISKRYILPGFSENVQFNLFVSGAFVFSDEVAKRTIKRSEEENISNCDTYFTFLIWFKSAASDAKRLVNILITFS